MPPPGAGKRSRRGPAAGPRRRVAQILSSGLSRTQVSRFASRLSGALPAVIIAPAGTTLWRSALIGPAHYPKGYRDAVVLSQGRLLGVKVRQAGRDGHLHSDPAGEIGRALAAYRAEDRSHNDRPLRPLIPSLLVNATWLRAAADRHDVALNPSLTASLLEAVNASGRVARKTFRETLHPDVAELLKDDVALERFHNWISDDLLDQQIIARRRAAFRAALTGCEHIRQRERFAARLDAGEDALPLLGEILDATPDALERLKGSQPDALGSLEEAQRKAWAIELMDPEVMKELELVDPKKLREADALDVAGGWAGRAMSFAAAATGDPAERRGIARRLLARPGLRRFIDYPATFKEWDYEEGREEFAGMLSAVVRFGLLPAVMLDADAELRRRPTPEKIRDAARELGWLASLRCGAMTIEIARLLWRKVEPWLAKALVAACHPERERWPQLIGRYETARTTIECLSTKGDLEKVGLPVQQFPTLLHDALVEGGHILRLSDKNGAVVALTVVRQEELETARKDGGVNSELIERDGWTASPQWKRWMRVEVARVVHAVATQDKDVPCDLDALRRAQDERAANAAAIAALPCGFDPTNQEARDATKPVGRIVKQLVRDVNLVTDRLFGPRRDPTLEADAAHLTGVVAPHFPSAPAPASAPTTPGAVSPLFRGNLVEESVDVPAEYDPSAAAGRIRMHIIRQKAAVPLDPLQARYIVLDTETTGLGKSDRVVEIAAIEMIGRRPTGKRFEALIDPRMRISDGAFEKHGITHEMLRGKPKFADVCEDLLKLFGRKAWFVAHYAKFDVDIINREFKRAGVDYAIAANRAICTLRLSEARLGTSALDDACDRLGIDRRRRTKHRAMLDAELCAEVFVQLIFGRAPSAPEPDPASPAPAAPASADFPAELGT